MITAHQKIAPTALLTAYLRSFSDIPYAEVMYRRLQREMAGGIEDSDLQNMLKPGLAPQLEARYKLVSALLQQSGITQIVELAAGYTTRGVALTEDSDITYVELDHSEVLAHKQKVLDEMRLISLRGNLHFVTGNALEIGDLKRTTAPFDPSKPIAIINEGLMRYMTFPEKTALAHNIRTLLETRDGIWITPDISLQEGVAQEDQTTTNFSNSLSKLSGQNIHQNLFRDNLHAQAFFEDLGFTVEVHSYKEVQHTLASPSRLNIASAEVDRVCGPWVAFVMKVA